jgi:hypothetical protein
MNDNKTELMNNALKERIGAIVSNYEEQMASIRAEATIIIERLTQENERLTKELENVAVQED